MRDTFLIDSLNDSDATREDTRKEKQENEKSSLQDLFLFYGRTLESIFCHFKKALEWKNSRENFY